MLVEMQIKHGVDTFSKYQHAEIVMYFQAVKFSLLMFGF